LARAISEIWQDFRVFGECHLGNNAAMDYCEGLNRQLRRSQMTFCIKFAPAVAILSEQRLDDIRPGAW